MAGFYEDSPIYQAMVNAYLNGVPFGIEPGMSMSGMNAANSFPSLGLDAGEAPTLGDLNDSLTMSKKMNDMMMDPATIGIRQMFGGGGAINPQAFEDVVTYSPLDDTTQMSWAELQTAAKQKGTLDSYIAQQILNGETPDAIIAGIQAIREGRAEGVVDPEVEALVKAGVPTYNDQGIERYDYSRLYDRTDKWSGANSMVRQYAWDPVKDQPTTDQAGKIATATTSPSETAQAYIDAGYYDPRETYDPNSPDFISPEKLAWENQAVGAPEAMMRSLLGGSEDAIRGALGSIGVGQGATGQPTEEAYLAALRQPMERSRSQYDEQVKGLDEYNAAMEKYLAETVPYYEGLQADLDIARQRDLEASQGDTRRTYNVTTGEWEETPRSSRQVYSGSGSREGGGPDRSKPYQTYDRESGVWVDSGTRRNALNSLDAFQQGVFKPQRPAGFQDTGMLNADWRRKRDQYYRDTDEYYGAKALSDWAARQQGGRQQFVEQLYGQGYNPFLDQVRGQQQAQMQFFLR
jgi:hypothetical protein